MPTFLTIFLANVNSGQESRALGLCLQEVFKRLGSIRPKAIVIDNYLTEYHAFRDVMNEYDSPMLGKWCHSWPSKALSPSSTSFSCKKKRKEKRIEHLLSIIRNDAVKNMYTKE